MTDPLLKAEIDEADALMGAASEEGAAAVPPQTEPANVPDYRNPALIGNASGQIQAVMAALVNIAAPMFPALQQVYTPETIKAVGDSVAPVAIKRNWLPKEGGLLDKWAEEITALSVMVPLSMSTVAAIRFDLDRMDKSRAAQAEEQPAAGETEEQADG